MGGLASVDYTEMKSELQCVRSDKNPREAPFVKGEGPQDRGILGSYRCFDEYRGSKKSRRRIIEAAGFEEQ